MGRKRRHGLAASIAARKATVSPVDQPIEHATASAHRNRFALGKLWDRQARPWHRVDEWLDPDEARALVQRGVGWVVEWCGGGFWWPDELSPDVLPSDVLPAMVTRERAKRLARKRTVPTVFVAERWQDETGKELVVFYESGPYPRADTWFA